MKFLASFIKEHFGAVTGALIGLIIAVLMLIIGFWPVVLIVLFTALGGVIGGSKYIRRIVPAWIKSFFDKLMNK